MSTEDEAFLTSNEDVPINNLTEDDLKRLNVMTDPNFVHVARLKDERDGETYDYYADKRIFFMGWGPPGTSPGSHPRPSSSAGCERTDTGET